MTISRMDVPIGTVLDYAGNSIPSGYLECDGSAVSRTAYPKLFAAIGTAWGAGDGSTTFNLPNLGGRACIGKGTRSVGNTGGSETHTLTANEIPSHAHTINHGHGFTQPTVDGGWIAGAITGGWHNHTVDNYRAAGEAANWTLENVKKTHGYDHPTSSTSHSHDLPSHAHNVYGGAVANMSGNSGNSGGGVCSQHHAALRRRAEGHTRRLAERLVA